MSKITKERRKITKLKVLSVVIVLMTCYTSLAPITKPITNILEQFSYNNYNLLGKYATILSHNIEILDWLLIKNAYADNEVIGSGGSSNNQFVTNGETVSGTIINSGGTQNVQSGGSAINTIINSLGDQMVLDGGNVRDTRINFEGRQLLFGSATNTIVRSGGQQYISITGSATNTIVESGGTIDLVSGGSATDVTLLEGSVIRASTSATLTGTYNGSIISILNGTANNITLNWFNYRPGYLQVESGDTANSTTINSGGIQKVQSGGSATGTIVNPGGFDSVQGVSTGTTINGGEQEVYDSGITIGTIINSGGQQWVYDSGTATGTIINSGGLQNVCKGSSSGGIANNTIVNSGGQQYVSSNGTVNNTTINPGGLLSFKAGAQVLGATTLNAGTISISGNGSAAINSLTANGGIVNFNPTYQGSPVYNKSLIIGDLSGNGATFKINTDGQSHNGNKIDITSAAGTYNLIIRDTAMKNGNSIIFDQPLTVVTVINNGGTNFNPIPIDDGACRYTPTIVHSGGEWQLVSINSGASEASITSQNSLVANIEVMRTENNNLMKRMGDLRHNQGEAGFWTRVYSGENEIRLSHSLNYDYHAIQLGYDKRNRCNNGVWYTGLAIDRIEGNTTYERGNGENNSTSVGLYGTWVGNKGHYLDIIAKLMWLNTKYNSWDLLNNQSYGSYNNRGTSFSVEYGYQKQFDKGWYIEPQVEVNFGHQGSVNYQDSQGINIQMDSVNSTIGRMGLLIGRKIGEKTKPTNFYLKASIAHEFDGKVNMMADTLNMREDLKDTWYEIGFGITNQLDENNNIYFELEKIDGDKIDSPWKVNLGLRRKL